jgi:hypothetical protein
MEFGCWDDKLPNGIFLPIMDGVSSRQTGFFVTELVPKPGWFWNKLIY